MSSRFRPQDDAAVDDDGATRKGAFSGGSPDASSSTAIFALDREDRWRAPGVRIGGIRSVAAGGGTVIIATTGHVLRWSAADSSAPPEGACGPATVTALPVPS